LAVVAGVWADRLDLKTPLVGFEEVRLLTIDRCWMGIVNIVFIEEEVDGAEPANKAT
jgi:hypothetical protein